MKISDKLLRTGALPHDFPSNALQIASGGSQKSLNRLSEVLKNPQMATMSSQIRHLYEFGPFRLDPQKRLLLRGSEPVSLTRKAIETLIVLVENRERVVSKDHLIRTLWPDSFVEESNLSQNIFVLRKALGDSTQEKRYILTVPGQGYQFTEAVREVDERQEEETLIVASHSHSVVAVEVGRESRIRTVAIIFVCVALIGAGAAWWTLHRSESQPQFTQRRLTANPPDTPVTEAAISPDGKYLGYSDQQGIHIQLVGTGETKNVPPPQDIAAKEAYWDFKSWYPDGTRFIACLAIPGKPISLWLVHLLGGSPRLLIDDVYGDLGISPDGSAIAFSRVPVAEGAREIWVMGPDGESPHRILASDDQLVFGSIVWSPKGERIAYVLSNEQGQYVAIETCDPNGGHKNRILAGVPVRDFIWMAPNRFIYSLSTEDSNVYYSDNLWELLVNLPTGAPQGIPRKLTAWSGFWVSDLNVTADGKHLQFLRGTNHETVFAGELSQTNGLTRTQQLTTDDYSNLPLAWMPDSKQVIFSSLRTGTRQIYRQAVDGKTPAQLISTDPSLDLYLARVGPDGAELVLEGEPHSSRKLGLYRVAASGGVPQLLFEVAPFVNFQCTNQRANLCAYGQILPEQKELVITAFDPINGQRKELRRINVEPGEEYHWALSPDGSRIGILKSDWNSSLIQVFPVHDNEIHKITVKGYLNLISLDWAPDSNSLFVASSGPAGSEILRIKLDGSVRLLWQQPQSAPAWGVASPDGLHLAIMGQRQDSNVWMIDNF